MLVALMYGVPRAFAGDVIVHAEVDEVAHCTDVDKGGALTFASLRVFDVLRGELDSLVNLGAAPVDHV